MSVYFIQDGSGRVKIGCASDPFARMRALQVGSADILRMARIVDGTKPTEKWLHRRFSEQKIHGEWFEFHPDMETVVPPDEIPACEKRRRAQFRSLIEKLADAKRLGLVSEREVDLFRLPDGEAA